MRAPLLLLLSSMALYGFELSALRELGPEEALKLRVIVLELEPADPTLYSFQVMLPENYEGKTYKQAIYVPDRSDMNARFVMATGEPKRIVDVLFRRKDVEKPVLILSYGADSKAVRLDPTTVIGYIDFSKYVTKP